MITDVYDWALKVAPLGVYLDSINQPQREACDSANEPVEHSYIIIRFATKRCLTRVEVAELRWRAEKMAAQPEATGQTRYENVLHTDKQLSAVLLRVPHGRPGMN